MWTSPPLMHGVSLCWPLDLKAGAGSRTAFLATVATAEVTIVVLDLGVVAAVVAAAVGLSRAGAGCGEARQVDTLVVQHVVVVTAALTIVVAAAGDLDKADDVVEAGLGISLKQPKGLIIFPSLSIS